MTYRLALDIGANSIGWCILDLDAASPPQPRGIRDIGVRIFPDGRDPKTSVSLAAARRLARQSRRRRDRYLQRRQALLNSLIRHGLMPAETTARMAVAALDPYLLRAEALARRLEPYELGRVIFHLNQRRGFRSNRKTDRDNEDEKGKIRRAADRLTAEITRSGHKTLGAWLAVRHANRAGVRARLYGAGAKAEYPFYPTRELVTAEFDAIWAAQAQWNPTLAPAAGDELRKILLFQRDLRQPLVGRCWLEPTEDRASRALPSTQAFRIAQDLAHLAIRRVGEPDQPLTDKQRNLLDTLLNSGRDLSFAQIRKQLGLIRSETFNLESRAREGLKGSETAARLAGETKGKDKPLRAVWCDLDLSKRDAIAAAIQDAESDEAAVAALELLGIPRSAAEAAAGTTLPDGHASLSTKAMLAILPHLRAGLVYSAAVQAAGYRHHSDDRDGVIHPLLPYYGEVLAERLGTGTGKPEDARNPERFYGRAPNPTVHVALNQLRQVINALIAQHGHPAEIVVEVLRELGQSAFERSRVEKEQTANAKRRADWEQQLKEIGQRVNPRNMAFMRLWVEQAADPKERVCPYTGEWIGIERLFSGEVEEDHILPFALTLDDSFKNRVLAMRDANRRKARQTPYDAFGASPDWPAIKARAAALPGGKAWRFAPDAMAKWQGEHRDFQARLLTDSAYLSRLTALYRRAICDPRRIWGVPGRLTAMLRGSLGLNSATLLGKGGARKERTDHRHHAIDALTVGLIDRSLLQRVSTAARRAQETGRRLLDDLEEPWPGFVAEAAQRVRGIVVSFKPDTAPSGALLKDTAFGPVEGRADGRNVRVRRTVAEIAGWAPSSAPKKGQPLVADPALRRRIDDILRLSGEERRAALASLKDPGGTPVRRVRALEVQTLLVQIKDRRSKHTYKLLACGENHRLDFWRLPDGTIKPEVVNILDAARELSTRGGSRGNPAGRPHPAAKLLMRLHKGDAVALGSGAERNLFVVKGIWASIVEFAPPSEAGSLGVRDRDKSDPFKMLRMAPGTILLRAVRKVFIDPIGRVRDPGPLDW